MRKLLSIGAVLWAFGGIAVAQPSPSSVPWTYHPSLPASVPCSGPAEGCAAWRTFREAHPWPYQSYAISQRGGYVIAIISEPPPRLGRGDLEDLARAAFGNQLESIARYRWATGIDGWLEDLVLTLKPANTPTTVPVLGPTLALWDAPVDVTEPLKFIDLALHGTADGFWLEDIDHPPTPAAVASFSVRPDEVTTWLSASGDWTSLGDGSVKAPWSGLIAKQGAYRSADGALVALVLPKGVPVASAERDFRRFALESDLLAAALRTTGQSFVLLGRKRQQSLSDLPPLRFETFAALAARRSDELAQSYERQRVFAGKILTGAFGGWDWAPILLSKQIEDSEFGTLLNQADQVLKSWSQAGQVRYLNFPIASPGRFPFADQPLSAVASTKLDAPSVIFNWNTRGFSVLTDQPAGRVLTADRSGVLPVLYLPLGESGEEMGASGIVSAAWAKTGRDYFDEIGHPLVTRVAQNTFLYQAANNLLSTPVSPAETAPSRSEIAVSAIQAEARAWLANVNGSAVAAGTQRGEVQQDVRRLLATPGMTLDKAAELLATSQVSASRVTGLYEKAGDLRDDAKEAYAQVKAKEAVYQRAADQTCAEAVRIGGTQTANGCEVNTTAERMATFVALKRTAITLQNGLRQAGAFYDAAVTKANAAHNAYQREVRAYEGAQRLGRKIAESAWLNADLDAVKDRVLAATAHDTTDGAIRTPTLVLSQNEVELWAVGGHNVGGRPPVKRLAANRVLGTVPEGKSYGNAPALRSAEAPRPSAQALLVRPDAPRSMVALVRSRPAVGDAQLQLTRARLKECGDCGMVIERVGDDYIVAKRPPPVESVSVARGASGVIDAIGELRPGMATHFHNVDARWARAVTESAAVRNAARPQTASLIDRAKALFGGGKKPPEPPQLVMDAPFPGEPDGRRTVSLFGDNPARVAKTARTKPNWAQAAVESPKADPLAWIEANPEIKALRGPRETHPVVVVVTLPKTDPIGQVAVVVEMTRADAAVASGARLQAIVQEQVRQAAPAADVAAMAARTRDHIRGELNTDDVNMFTRDNLGDIRIAQLDLRP